MSANRPVLLALAALGLAAAGVVLWLALRDDGGDPVPTGPTIAAPARPPPPLATPGREGAPVVTPTDQRPTTGEPVRTTIVNGVQVRDHRSGSDRFEPKPNVQPPDRVKLGPETIASIHAKLHAAVTECMADVPREARGPRPTLDGRILVAVRQGLVVITQSEVQLRDVTGALLDVTRRCMEDRASRVAVPASADETDIVDYPIMVEYVF